MTVSARAQTLLVAVGQAVGSLVSLATIAWLARVMPASELGVYLYFVAAAAALEGLSDLGLRLHGVAALSSAGSPALRAGILDALWRLKLVLSLVTVLVVLLAATGGWLQYADGSTALVLALVTVTLPSASPVVWDARARGLQWLEATLLVGYRLLLLGTVMLADPRALDAGTVLVALLATNVAFMVLLGAARERRAVALPGSGVVRADHGALLGAAAPFGASLLVAQLAPRVWVLVLAAVASSGEVATFSVAASILQTTLLVSVAAGAAYLPVLSRLAQGPPDQFRAVAGKLLETMALVGTMIAVGMALSSAGLVPALFGERLRPAGTTLVALSLLPPVLLVSFTSRIVLGALGTGRADLVATVAGVGIGLVVAWVLYRPFGTGAMVAGYATSEIVTCAAKLAALQHLRAVDASCIFRSLLRCAPAVLLAVGGGAVFAATEPALLPAVLAGLGGVVAYAVMLALDPSLRARGLRGLLP